MLPREEDWTQKTGEDLGKAVCAIVQSLWDADSGRRAKMLRNISRYESRKLATLSADSYRDSRTLTTEDGEFEVRWNLCRSLVETVTAKIAGGQQPKVSFVCSNADYRTRRKGPKLEQFISGLWSTRQGPYNDIWELGTAAFRDCAICDLGAVKIFSDTDAGRVIHDRVLPWELLVDPVDAQRGCPRNLFQRYSVPRAELLAYWPERADSIHRAQTDDGSLTYSSIQSYAPGSRVVDSIPLSEWWSLPLGPDTPGKHVLALGDGTCLIEEEWERDSFPFALVRWSRDFQGFFGRSLIDEVAAVDDEMNEILARISNTVYLTSIATCIVQEDANINSDLVDNGDAKVIKVDRPNALQYISPPPFAPEHITYLNLMKDACYWLSGVNQMTATATKQPGVDSAVAMRTIADIQSERFSVVWKAFQLLFVDIARHDIACVRELAEDDPNFAVKWPGNGFLRTVNWSSVDLEDDLYSIQVASAPGVKGSPADRLQTAQELFAAGQLSSDAFLAVRTYLDLPGEMDRASRQRNLIDQYVERWLDATPDEIAENKTSEGTLLFRAPHRLMRLEDAIVQVADAFMQAELDEAPDENLELLLRWIELADKEIQAKQARLATLNQPPAPPAMPGAQPMAQDFAA